MGSLRHITLRTKAILRLDPKASSDRWHALFLDCGLLSSTPPHPPPGSPLALLREARDRLLGLQALEDDLRHAVAPVGGFGNHAPSWAWALAMVVPVVSWQLTTIGETAEEQLMAFGAGVWTAAVIAAIGLGVVGAFELKARRERRERIDGLRARIGPLTASLGPSARAVLARSFVASAGNRLVVSTPHLAWLHACTAAVRRATAATSTNAGELVALIAELEADAVGVQDSLAALLEAPPQDWSEEGLAPELAGYRTRLVQLRVRPDPLCEALDEAWSAEG